MIYDMIVQIPVNSENSRWLELEYLVSQSLNGVIKPRLSQEIKLSRYPIHLSTRIVCNTYALSLQMDKTKLK